MKQIRQGAEVTKTPAERIETAMTLAQEAGIPESLLESKVEEGRAKGIPMDRIAAAVDTRLGNLLAAQAALGDQIADVDPALLSVSADAIGAGVSGAVVGAVGNTAGADRRTVALAALTQLVSEGVGSEDALVQVEAALARGPEALANLAAQGNVPTGVIPAGVPAGEPPMSVPAPGQAGPPEIPVPGAIPPTGGPPESPTPPVVPDAVP